jgi:hypothetical protein
MKVAYAMDADVQMPWFAVIGQVFEELAVKDDPAAYTSTPISKPYLLWRVQDFIDSVIDEYDVDEIAFVKDFNCQILKEAA